MSIIIRIAVRELRSYFGQPAAYAVLVVFLAVAGYLFTVPLFAAREANLGRWFASIAIVLLFLTPALTMRLVADEQRTGTLDLLLACPVQDHEVILGKYLGSLAFFAVMVAATAHFPLFLSLFGDPDYVPMAVGYFGVFLLGAAVLATGLWTSTLTSSQVVAYVVAFGVLLLMWSADAAGRYLGGAGAAFFDFVSLTRHYEDFTRGILDTRHVIYFLAWVLVFLGMSVRSLAARKSL